MLDLSTLLALTQDHANAITLDIELAQNRDQHIRLNTRLNETLALIREIRILQG